MANPTIVLKAQNLSKTYGKKQVLSSTDLSINKGECVVFCGGNGAGKSTLIKLLTGIEKPSSGIFQFLTSKKKSFGYMPDHMNFPGELSPIEVLMYYRTFVDASKEKMMEVIKKVGLWEVRNQKISSFSKGMSQRVNLAQALLSDVDVYIFDEPTNGLDPYWVIEFKNIIKDLTNNGKTVILSSHIMRDVAEISDRVFIIFEGQVKESGSLEEIYEKYATQTLEEVFLKLLEKSHSVA
ncbi:ABC transporter ATP-binding protein [Schinkia azotoformans]|uniref:Lantibiotic ABC transporter ATP-binding protein n=1 Tax=Schinkia azotoformans LMG 9581 TaxID=1131731 RepID=K6CVV0_SCHAZ|nr:ABC transporter ATP-binding protein [Schinkia azotoformans]EKN64367.1 lantibiotic ABC transporter ATP-binding protein [Schinkia azotoformans LMG 9581]MEC1637926.1 ABC transporter ATP-binding protein [Schinkia azotoformans]MEC1944823.1 ABC transporter ATP-binding protein [Schinkia azotoformans]